MNKKKTGNPVGRPKKFTSPKEMQVKIDEYFKKCDQRTRQVVSNGDIIKLLNPEPYTMAGLALILDLDRKSLLNYSKNDLFFPTIKTARLRVEQDVERRSNEGGGAGCIFNLKNNFGYKDKTEMKSDIKSESVCYYSPHKNKDN